MCNIHFRWNESYSKFVFLPLSFGELIPVSLLSWSIFSPNVYFNIVVFVFIGFRKSEIEIHLDNIFISKAWTSSYIQNTIECTKIKKVNKQYRLYSWACFYVLNAYKLTIKTLRQNYKCVKYNIIKVVSYIIKKQKIQF